MRKTTTHLDQQDRVTLERFASFLCHIAVSGYPANSLETAFDGDLHKVFPEFSMRDQYVVVNGQLRVKP